MALKSGRVGIHPSQVDPITGMLLVNPSGASDLSDLGDVNISDPEAGQILEYNATSEKWENVFASISPVTPATLASLQDVMLSDLQDGDFISYDATEEKWVNVGEAPAPTYTDITITLYSAVEDLVSFTDAAGVSHTEQFATNQSSKSITFKINPSGSTAITFTSSIAKDPNNLTNAYTKQVSITSGTTSVYFMPNDNVLYWYGYMSNDTEVMSTTNGWSRSGYTFTNPTFNANHVVLNSTGETVYCGIGTKNKIDSLTNEHIIAQGVTDYSSTYGFCTTYTTKDLSTPTSDIGLDSTSLKYYSYATSKTNIYLAAYSPRARKSNVYALWYE